MHTLGNLIALAFWAGFVGLIVAVTRG